MAFTDQHYPSRKELYYPGFEVFIGDSAKHITIAGIEAGPAKRAGFRGATRSWPLAAWTLTASPPQKPN